jgi:hypothetical protein
MENWEGTGDRRKDNIGGGGCGNSGGGKMGGLTQLRLFV